MSFEEVEGVFGYRTQCNISTETEPGTIEVIILETKKHEQIIPKSVQRDITNDA